MAEHIQALADRPQWTVEASVATYAPQPDGWTARVRAVTMPGHLYRRWHVAIIDPGGTCRHVAYASMIAEAARVAEGSVRGRNPTPAEG